MGMIFKGLTFGGINSLDYGIFITGEAVYNAPERSVTSIEIEGRNGDLLIDNGRFLNIEVSYPAGCFAESQQDFKEKIELFRNAIVSQISYQRLTDDYNPDEYRLAVYKSGLDVNVAVLHQGGEFTLTFDCKPQRFLTSGETERSIPEWSDMHTDSGSIVTVDNSSGEYAVKSLSTEIVPQQDLNGYDHPWAGGAGKNLLQPDTLQRSGGIAITATIDSNGVITINGTAESNTFIGYSRSFAAGSYIINGCPSGGGTSNYQLQARQSTITGTNIGTDTGEGKSFTLSATITVWATIRIASGYTANNLKFYPMIRLSTETDPTFAPYSNICPITGFTGANIYVSPTTSVGDATTYTVSFGSAGTVYGGTLDVVSGQLTVDRQSVTLDGTESWSKSSFTACDIFLHTNSSYIVDSDTMISSFRFVNASTTQGVGDAWIGSSASQLRIGFSAYGTTDLATFKTWLSNNPVQVVRKLATPLTYQLTATQVALLLGTNNIWSNTGDIQIEYGKGGNTLFNPTLFNSRPLIELTGAGTLGINNYIITITGSGKLYIDCDTMEAYTITGGIVTSANNRVSLNTTDYPVLRSGMNNLSVGTGISNVKITPRWWRV